MKYWGYNKVDDGGGVVAGYRTRNHRENEEDYDV